MRFHSAGQSLRWGADDECIVRLISTSKKCGGYGYQSCVCVCVCLCKCERQEVLSECVICVRVFVPVCLYGLQRVSSG